MARSKDFSNIKTERQGRTPSTLDRGTSKKGQQGTATPEEQAERAAALTTQGRKGCKAVRINMAFTPENHDFVKSVAMARAETMTQYVNHIIEQYRLEHGELYQEILRNRKLS